MLSRFRRTLKRFHPEGIPFPGTKIYNAVSRTGIFQRHYELIAKDITGFCPKGSVLDIGTGPGWLLVKIHEQSPRLKLTGMDISPSMAFTAHNNMLWAGLYNIIQIAAGDVSAMPFHNNEFDLVASTGAVHHWKDYTSGLNEIHRVLKRGGHALLYDIVSDTPRDILEKAASEFGKLRMLLFWLHAFEEPFYTVEDFQRLPGNTPFLKGATRFVGVMDCLVLRKE